MLVFGGSQGALSINRAAIAAFAGARFHVLHAAGERDLSGPRSGPGPHYDLRGYIPRFDEALLASDLVVARAGGSIFEVAAAGRPAVLIPYPYATADHQTANARFMERAGAAVVIPDTELSAPRLAQEVGALLADRKRLAAMANASAAIAKPDAAREIARELLSWPGPRDATGAQYGSLRVAKAGAEPAVRVGGRARPRPAGQKVPPGGPPPQPLLLPGTWVHINASTFGNGVLVVG